MKIALTCSVLLFLAACGTSDRKVLVMASGKIAVNANTITLEPGTTHNETTITPDGDSITVVTGSSTVGFGFDQPGVYLLNLKKDTLVGSYQHTGTDNSTVVVTQASLPLRIDSLRQLMAGTNVSAEGRNFHIPPMSVERITGNTNAELIGPYVKIPGSFEGGKEHEVYKFYTNREMREIVNKLTGLVSDTLRVVED